MSESVPQFGNPPVVETVLGVQFDPLAGFSTAHAGSYWTTIRSEWPTIVEVAELPEAFERFGDERVWGREGIHVRPGTAPNRVQIINTAEDRMIQIQRSRFIYNWRKRNGHYPSFAAILPEFREKLAAFTEFVRVVGLGDVQLNQWEVTYVNHLPRGALWDSPKDWRHIFPGFFAPADNVDGQRLESSGGEWSYVLGQNEGRLHVKIRHARVGGPTGPEALALTFTARGPVSPEQALQIDQCLRRGHEAIVSSFVAMTSGKAHEAWKRTA